MKILTETNSEIIHGSEKSEGETCLNCQHFCVVGRKDNAIIACKKQAVIRIEGEYINPRTIESMAGVFETEDFFEAIKAAEYCSAFSWSKRKWYEWHKEKEKAKEC